MLGQTLNMQTIHANGTLNIRCKLLCYIVLPQTAFKALIQARSLLYLSGVAKHGSGHRPCGAVHGCEAGPHQLALSCLHRGLYTLWSSRFLGHRLIWTAFCGTFFFESTAPTQYPKPLRAQMSHLLYLLSSFVSYLLGLHHCCEAFLES